MNTSKYTLSVMGLLECVDHGLLRCYHLPLSIMQGDDPVTEQRSPLLLMVPAQQSDPSRGAQAVAHPPPPHCPHLIRSIQEDRRRIDYLLEPLSPKLQRGNESPGGSPKRLTRRVACMVEPLLCRLVLMEALVSLQRGSVVVVASMEVRGNRRRFHGHLIEAALSFQVRE